MEDIGTIPQLSLKLGEIRNDSRFYEEKTLGFILDFIGGEPLLEIDLID